MPNIRKQMDSIGVVEVTANKLWADQTQRSLETEHCHTWHDGHVSAAGWV